MTASADLAVPDGDDLKTDVDDEELGDDDANHCSRSNQLPTFLRLDDGKT